MFKFIKWLFKSKVEFLSKEFDVTQIIIDDGCGNIDSISLNRRQFFQLATVCNSERIKKYNSFILEILDSDKLQVVEYKLFVPSWAKERVFKKTKIRAKELNWNGIPVNPRSESVYR